MQFTRRKLLAGIGLGAFGAGGFALGRSQPRYTHYTYAATEDHDDRQLRIAWYERYNGAFVESQNGTNDADLNATLDPETDPAYVTDADLVTDVAGPVIAVGNVLPGDEGTLVVGLEAAADASLLEEPLDVWLHTAITDDAESDVNGPEAAAGDATTDDGELDDEVFVEVWRDGSPLGTCNGRKDFDETLEGPVVERASIDEAFGPSSDAGSDTGILAIESLGSGQSRCLALGWEFPLESATNRSQGDSVQFDFVFGAVPAGSASPFSDVTTEDADGN
jgi:hypothetical protein